MDAFRDLTVILQACVAGSKHGTRASMSCSADCKQMSTLPWNACINSRGAQGGPYFLLACSLLRIC